MNREPINAKAEMLIRRPVADVFQAFCRPATNHPGYEHLVCGGSRRCRPSRGSSMAHVESSDVLGAERDAVPIFAALGAGPRLKLVNRLSSEGPSSIARLSRGSGLTRQAITKHLRVLADVQLVHSSRRGRETLWALDPQPLDTARTSLDASRGNGTPRSVGSKPTSKSDPRSASSDRAERSEQAGKRPSRRRFRDDVLGYFGLRGGTLLGGRRWWVALAIPRRRTAPNETSPFVRAARRVKSGTPRPIIS
jgi:DNA-binding transcriptional ArsR family regulator